MGENLNQMHQKDSVLIRKPSKPCIAGRLALVYF